MTNRSNAECPRCEAELPTDESQGLCAACLMLEAMNEGQNDETLMMEQGPSLAMNGPEAFPCEFGEYRLLRLLGRGGMGAVYEAEHSGTGRRVALKLLGQQLESGEMRQRFLREGRLAAGVSHPNSLYVFGAEEIEGVPVIAMEIAEGGTLSDELQKKGPLAIPDAVDAVLEIIAGLEAAQSVGVLHRDVKPSNIFVAPTGAIKVGDYGLSVSTVASVDSFATATGVTLGTPAFAAPEQLKGGDLDVRADIYSVGATLFTLLTNRAPIEGNNPVQIVAAALDEKPPTVRSLREDVPAALSALVARCLSKRPDQRFASYRQLRSALLPFSSRQAQAGALHRRFLAGILDATIGWWFPGSLVTAYYGRMNTVEMVGFGEWLPILGLGVWHLLFVGVPEGIWGQGLGKWLCGLRVARSGGQSLGLARGLARAALNWVSCQGAVLVLLLIFALGLEPPMSPLIANLAYGSGQFFFLLIPFFTMRRFNAWALGWDLLTDSRVFEKPNEMSRVPVNVADSERENSQSTEWLGPYALIERLSDDWIVAHDPALRRNVWLRRSVGEPVDDKRRSLARPSRSRWQQAVCIDGETWDAFEAQGGMALPQLIERDGPVSWKAMLHWLHDLSLELAQGGQDGTLPSRVGLGNIWITTAGRAVLLDSPWPGSNETSLLDVSGKSGQLALLARVVEMAKTSTIPLHAHAFVQNLKAGSFEKLSFLAGNLQSLMKKRVRVDPATRAASLLALPAFLLLMAMFAILVAGPASMRAKARVLQREFPGLPALNDVLRYRYAVPVEDRRFIRVHIAGHYQQEDFSRELNWDRFRSLGEYEHKILNRIKGMNISVEPEELQEADKRLREVIPQFLERTRQRGLVRALETAAEFTLRSLAMIALLQFVTLGLFRASVGQYLFGFAVIATDGRAAGRGRLLLRWFIAWGLLLIAVFGKDWLGEFSWFLLALWLVGVLIAVWRPATGLHDEWSGCSLVAR